LRIQARKLRYASDFYRRVPRQENRAAPGGFRGKPGEVTGLGDLNDIAVHEGLTERIVDAQETNGKGHRDRAKKAFATGRLSGREAARISSVLKDAERAYGAFTKAKPFWQ
jgi:hypothetical protein